MSEDKDQSKPEKELTPSKMPTDWDPDRFPTSAKPVFTSMGMLALIITVLCFLVYYTSVHTEAEVKEEKKLTVEDSFLADEQLDEVEADEDKPPSVEAPSQDQDNQEDGEADSSL